MMATGVDAKLLKSTKFPPEFNQKVDMHKVNVQVMKKWIAGKVTEILGGEDDVVIELIFNLIEGGRHPDIKSLQIQLTGFLDKDTGPFCKELWKLLLSAQMSPQGVPKKLLEAKKLELIQEKIEADKAAEEARRQREESERRGRGRGGRIDSWRGGRREDSDFGRRGGFGREARRSRSPSPFRDGRDRVGTRGRGGFCRSDKRDSYVPRGSPPARRDGGGDGGGGRRRWPIKSISRSVSVDSASSRSRSSSPERQTGRKSSHWTRSPAPRRRNGRPRSPSPLRNRKRSFSRTRRPGHRRRSPSITTDADSLSPRPKRRRHSLSPSLSADRPRRRMRSLSCSGSSDYLRSPSRSRSPARRSARLNRSVSHEDGGIRHRGRGRRNRSSTRSNSPAPRSRRRRRDSRSVSRDKLESDRDSGKRRRRSSSHTPIFSPRDKPADDSGHQDRRNNKASRRDKCPHSATAEQTEPKSAEREANERREQELRDKIKKMRSSKSGASNADTNRG